VPRVIIDGVPTEVPANMIFQDDGQTPLLPAGRIFTEDDIARARQEEKDKLYSSIERNNTELTQLREQVGSLTAAEQRRQAQLEEEQARLEEEARRQEQSTMEPQALVQQQRQEFDQRIQQMNQDWEQRFQESEQQRQIAEAQAAKEREFATLRDYTLSQVEANKDNIAPQLLPWIQGNTQAEVDASIQRAVATTNEIVADLQQAQIPDPTQQVQQPFSAQPPTLPGTRPTGGPANTDPSAGFQQLTVEQINAMPMQEYAKLRPQIGIGGQNNNRGLFG
jgi:hypothetical protein